jgi:Ring finger domain
MKKKIIIATFVIVIASSCPPLQAHKDKSFWEWLFSLVVNLGDDNQSSSDQKLEQQISCQIDHMLATAHQTPEAKSEIAQVRQIIVYSVIQELKSNVHTSDHEKLEEAQILTKTALIQCIVDKANKYAQEKAWAIYQDKNPPINPELIREHFPYDVAQKANDRMVSEAQHAAQDSRYGALCNFIGESLRNKVSFIVEQEYGIHYNLTPYYYQPESIDLLYPSIPKPPSQPVPSCYGEIFEIYPNLENDLERNKDFFGRVERKQIFRETDCCICLESFKVIGKRVTLYCGHSLCANCLFGILYLSNNARCPLCRTTIIYNEFSAEYLKKHVQVNVLKQTHPHNIDDIRKYFPWA